MTEQELLLIDLCARLPYGVKVTDDMGRCRYLSLGDTNLIDLYYSDVSGSGCTIKPYLRPMSSMTEKESKEFKGFCDEFEPDSYWYPGKYLLYVGVAIVPILIDWLNAHHFDYRGLIEKGLALEAPEDMYKFE